MAECSRVSYLLLFFLSVEAPRSELREYQADVPVSIPLHEDPIQWCTSLIRLPDVEAGFCNAAGVLVNLATPYAPYLGLIIAGRAEFPWIVDVSNQDLDEETYAVGNLVSDFWVATAGHIFLEWASADECGPSESASYQVKFCTNYLDEDYYKYAESFTENEPIAHLFQGSDSAGTRLVARIIKHPLCTRWSREWDLMMIRLNNPIRPLVPEIGFMPLPLNDLGESYLPKINPANLINQVCYLATFGRHFRQHPQPVNWRFKSRYRAYHVDWQVCHDKRDALVSIDGITEDLIGEWFFDQGAGDFGGRQLMCFEMRNYNGAVCQHDQGSPMVCDGVVIGFLVRGVGYHLCTSGSPYPFVVGKVDAFNMDFFRGIPQHGLTRPTTPTTPFVIPLNNFTRRRDHTINWQRYAPYWKN